MRSREIGFLANPRQFISCLIAYGTCAIVQRLFAIMIVVGLGMLAYTRYHEYRVLAVPPAAETTRRVDSAPSSAAAPAAKSVQTDSFSCDGRIYCSEMRSCEEAKYFLSNCPNTRMDGDHDGIPCERQWCASEARRSNNGWDDRDR